MGPFPAYHSLGIGEYQRAMMARSRFFLAGAAGVGYHADVAIVKE